MDKLPKHQQNIFLIIKCQKKSASSKTYNHDTKIKKLNYRVISMPPKSESLIVHINPTCISNVN